MALRPLFKMTTPTKHIRVKDVSEPADLTVIDDPVLKQLMGVDPTSVYLTYVPF